MLSIVRYSVLMEITARFASLCPKCNVQIREGQRVNWERGSKATHVVCPAVVIPISTPAYVPDRFLTKDDVGSYVLRSDTDTVFHVVETRDHTRYYAEKFVLIGGERTTEAGTVLNGDWQFESNSGERYSKLVARLIDANKLRRMTADEVIDFAVLYGRCVQHGGFLKSADSVDAGIGPVCAAKLGLDRKALAEANRSRRAAQHAATSVAA